MLEKRGGLYYRNGVQITPEEYTDRLKEIREKAALVNSISQGLTSIEDVPDKWQEEIQQRVEERLAESKEEDQEISTEEAIEVIVGSAV